MVKERDVPKAPLSPAKVNQPSFSSPSNQPEFGKPTFIQAPRQSSPSVFNIPKSNRPRPEHHRPTPTIPQQPRNISSQSVESTRNVSSEAYRPQGPVVIQLPYNPPPPPTAQPFSAPLFSSKPVYPVRSSDVVEITRPSNFPIAPARPADPPLFSSHSNAYTDHDSFNKSGPGNWTNLAIANARVFEEDYGTFDPGTYIDPAKANENIKALLEGAFEDEDDLPRTRLRKKKVQSGLEALSAQLKGVVVTGKAAPPAEEEEEEENDGTVEGLEVKLLPHQIEGVAWMCEKEFGTKKVKGVFPKGGILADDMGLGKTIQSLALILTNTKSQMKEKEREKLHADTHHGTLVVAPLALIKQWEAEIKEKVSASHKLKVVVHHGPQRHTRAADLKKYDVVITTYQTMTSEHGHSPEKGPKTGCFGVQWYRIILDEAHMIKNRNAKATKACCALKSEYRWCLSGTPMQNSLDELQSLINFLQIKPYNDLSIWRAQITKPMSGGKGGLAIRRLQIYLKAFMKRRTKDVLKKDGALTTGTSREANSNSATFQITKRQIEKIEAEFTPEERGYYQRLEQRADKSLEKMMSGDALNYASALVLLLRLRQACNSPALVGGSLAKDKDALATLKGSESQASKAQASDEDIDSVADMFGSLSMASKKCDICQIALTKEERFSGAIRCTECEADLKAQTTKAKRDKKKSKKKSKSSSEVKLEETTRRKQKPRRVIMDSDDEENEGERIVSKDKQKRAVLGKACGADDEDAEGGGEWLNSGDSATDEEAETKSNIGKKKMISLDSSDEDDDEDSEEEDEDEDDSEDDSFDEAQAKDMVQSTKIRNLMQILRRESGKYKFIVFSQFTTMLDLIEPFLKRDGLSFTRYDGSMRNDQREASLDRLRNSSRCRILLCSLRCGSLGLNLTAASRVVIMEPFWNPFVEEQAIDRVHRLNQTLDVIVYKMTIKDTVEARILELQEKKRELANATIEGKMGMNKLSLKDLLALFHHDAEHQVHPAPGAGTTGGLNQDYGTKSRLLDTTLSQSGSGTSAVPGRGLGLGTDKGRVPSRQKEDSVYGRRW